MIKEEIIKALRDMARYPTVTLPRDSEALKAAADLLAQTEQEPVAYVKTVIEALYENSDPISVEAAELLERITTPPPCPTCEALARTVMMDQTGRDA